jgi:hypothetical protein
MELVLAEGDVDEAGDSRLSFASGDGPRLPPAPVHAFC